MIRLGYKAALALGVLGIALAGCAEPEYDASTPEAALDSLHQMIVDGRADLIPTLVHVEARDITFADGVTEASAISEVLAKAGDMLGQLQRVSRKLHERYPDEVQAELAGTAAAVEQSFLLHGQFDRFLANPFGALAEERERLSAEDLGDGTAAVLRDGQPLFGFGLLMREVDGRWKIDLPVSLIERWRPNTREEWAVVASLMLGLENSLRDFEDALDDGRFRNLSHASQYAGRLLVETAIVQQMIYTGMKRNRPGSSDATEPADPQA